MELLIESDRVRGEIATKVAGTEDQAPGILFNYRLGYASGVGDVVTEKFIRLFVTSEKTVTTNIPNFTETIPQSEAAPLPTVERLSSMAKDLHEVAEMEGWTQVEAFADEARAERERETELKRKHAERYLEGQIDKWKTRLEP